MIRQTARRHGAKALVVSVIATAVAAIVPAQAAATPTVASTSFGKYNKERFKISAAYNLKVDPLLSSVTVLKNDNTPVNGSDYVTLTNEKELVFQAAAGAPFNELDAPYTATFTARSQGQTIGSPSAVDTFTFDIDFITPFPPDVELNEEAEGNPAIVLPDGEILVNGIAADPLSEANTASGIKQVQIHFYNPLFGVPGSAPSFGEIQSLRKTINFDCTVSCNTIENLAVDISSIPAGYWNVKVSTTDEAGNKSAQGEPMPMLKLG